MLGGMGNGPVVKAAAAEAEGPVRISGGVMAGKRSSQPQPVYPPIAKAAHVQGTVVLHAIIGKDGTIQDLQVISGPPMLSVRARMRYGSGDTNLTVLNGEPTEVDTTITVNFNFNGGAGITRSKSTAARLRGLPKPRIDAI